MKSEESASEIAWDLVEKYAKEDDVRLNRQGEDMKDLINIPLSKAEWRSIKDILVINRIGPGFTHWDAVHKNALIELENKVDKLLEEI